MNFVIKTIERIRSWYGRKVFELRTVQFKPLAKEVSKGRDAFLDKNRLSSILRTKEPDYVHTAAIDLFLSDNPGCTEDDYWQDDCVREEYGNRVLRNLLDD